MIYNHVIRGKFVDLKSITLDDEDVAFSYRIRMEEKNRDTVGQPASSLSDQKKFIEWQINQPDDYYFVVRNKKGQRVGLIGIYDIHDGVGEAGREVSDGTPEEAMEAELLLEKFYREILGLKRVVSVIYMSNKKHISNQTKRGLEMKKTVIRNGVECAYYEMEVNEKNYEKTRLLLSKIRRG